MLRSAVAAGLRANSRAVVRLYAAGKPDFWQHIEETPLDNIKKLTEEFNSDSFPQKVNLGEGVYRDENGKPFVLAAVREAEKRLYENKLDHEYAPVSGVSSFCNLTRQFAFGEDSQAIKDQRIATVQAISGTGALRLGGEFLKRFVPNNTVLYLPNPSWMNHNAIFKNAGFEIRQYRYFNKNTNGLDFEGMVADLKAAPKRSIILFHACAHNPTGVDPTMEQWKELSKLTMEKDHLIFFDSAYQGFASGDPVRDAQPFRYFVEQGHTPVVAQSYAKNFGLYGERIGAFNVVCNNKAEAVAVDSQLKVIIRAMYSNPPIYGARLVSTVLADKELSAIWDQDLKKMAFRIRDNRASLVQKLAEAGSTKNWSHITSQIGMFAYTGLTPEQVNRIKSEFHVYMTQDGRISISGINPSNIDYLAKAMHAVTK